MNGLDEFLNVFGNISFANVIEILIAVGFIIFLIKQLHTFFKKKLEEENETKENTQKILEATNRIPEIERKVDALEQTQNDTIKRIEYIESENKRRECTSLRERMIQSYRYYTDPGHNPLKQITRLEYQAFDDIFRDYVAAGGDGFVKEKLKPEFDQLEIIEMNDQDAVKALMQSRK